MHTKLKQRYYTKITETVRKQNKQEKLTVSKKQPVRSLSLPSVIALEKLKKTAPGKSEERPKLPEIKSTCKPEPVLLSSSRVGSLTKRRAKQMHRTGLFLNKANVVNVPPTIEADNSTEVLPPISSPTTTKNELVAESLPTTVAAETSKYFSDPKKAEKHRRAAVEILDTEITYVSSLNIVKTHFLKPLRKSETIPNQRPLLSPEITSKVFSNWRKLLKFHEDLLAQLKTRMQLWKDDCKIADIFDEKRIRSFVYLYERYVNNYSTAFITLTEAKKNSSTLRNFLRKAEQKSGVRLGLEDFLIMPVQRIPRYVLLIDKLLDMTPQEHPDYTGLTYAYEQLKLVADVVNARKKQHDDESEVKKILSEIQDCPTQQLLQTSSLSVVKWGVLKQLAKDKTKQKIYVVLLNRYLIFALIKNERKKIYQFLEVLPLLNSEAYVTKSGEMSCIVVKPPPNSKYPTYQFTHDNIDHLLSWHQEIVKVNALLIMALQEEAQKEERDIKREILNNFIEQETQYVHNLKRLQQIVTDVKDKFAEQFFESIIPISFGHSSMLEKLIERITAKNTKIGDIFEKSLRELLMAYNLYCILWVEIEGSFVQMKEEDSLFASCATLFEEGYGDIIEKFLENIAQHLPDMYTVTHELLQNTDIDLFPEEHEKLEHASEQLRNFANKILVLKEFNEDNHRHRTIDNNNKSKKKKRTGALARISLRW